MAINLGGVRRVIENMLEDLVEARRPGGEDLDESTGALVPAPGELVWKGAAAVLPSGRPALTPPTSGAVAAVPAGTMFLGLLPLDAPEMDRDTVITVTGSSRADGPRDPQIVGCRFRVGDTTVSTFAVIRMVRLEKIDGRTPHLP